MSFHVGELSQFTARITKLGNFMIYQNFSPKIRNSREFPPGIFEVADSREFPGIPEREFPVALVQTL